MVIRQLLVSWRRGVGGRKAYLLFFFRKEIVMFKPFCYLQGRPVGSPLELCWDICYNHIGTACSTCPLKTSYLHAEAQAWDPSTQVNTTCFRYFRHMYYNSDRDDAYYNSLIRSTIESCDNAAYGPIKFVSNWPRWKRILHRLL